MADIVTGTVTGQVNLGEVLRDLGTIRREGEVGVASVNSHIKDGTDTVKDQSTAFFIAAQNNSFSNSTALAALTAGTNAQFTATQVAIELAQDKNAAATALAQALLGSQIAKEGELTRALFQASKIEDLRFENLKRDHGHERAQGKFTYGPPVSAIYDTVV